VLTQCALCLGLSLIVSSLNVFFRDTEHLLGVILMAWFFLTPIIYPLSYIPPQYHPLAFLNPMTGIVTAYRAVFLGTGVPSMSLMAVSLALPWVIAYIGYALSGIPGAVCGRTVSGSSHG